ncbi:LuxR C-terminal-related transcriptional regulator [Oceanobacillus halophilus]|uniref:HTH luxR-type domain-containing protein n=1 Tax=Oceanobacillus halophilus TaxID=930130 RepID=A0A495A2G8_9BACI|nr:LuxR C-terminal-related transcriptional regulator [Oceanobacillus halophilus]RKQ33262.1 hypothetical protein D8M06_10845 [Oceanobacillus halophilus]
MIQRIELLQELQKSYAEKYNLSIIMTDDNGKIILDRVGNNPLFNWFYDNKREVLQEEFNRAKEKKVNTAPYLYDIWPGAYMIVAPFHGENGHIYLIWAGIVIVEGTEQLVNEQLQESVNINFIEMINNTPVITHEPNQPLMKRIKRLAHLATIYFKDHDKSDIYEIQKGLFRKVLEERSQLNTILEESLQNNLEFDFFGIAKKHSDDHYKVTEVFGHGVKSMRGMTFSHGEGLIGRPLITDKYEYWENVEKDPRSVSLSRYGLKPKSFFCYPLKRYQDSSTLLFGGSHSNSKMSTRCRELGKILGSILETGFLIEDLQKENQQQINRLTSMVEISKLMVSTHDFKRIVYILVDISLNLMEGPFTCVVLKEQHNDSVNLVSRGNPNGNLREYAKNVAERHFLNPVNTQQFEIITPKFEETPWGERTLECPLWNRGRIVGVLCVAINEQQAKLQEHVNFLQTLSVIGGVSLQIVEQEEEELDDKLVYSLFRAIKQFDQDVYSILEEAAKIAKEFAEMQGLPVPVINEITHSCLLSYYSSAFIQETLPETRLRTVIDEGNTLLNVNKGDSWESASISAQVFALAMAYVKDQSINKLEKVYDGRLIKDFKSFLYETQVLEEKVSIAETSVSIQEQVLDTVTSTIQELKLSPREQEVLDLVIQGYNNKEIAQQLYISGHTVKNHVTKIFQKLEVPDRAHAISKVYRLKHQSG